MRAALWAWLHLVCRRPAFALRMATDSQQCLGDATQASMIINAERQMLESLQQGAPAQFNPKQFQLNGVQWCKNNSLPSAGLLRGRVALILTGQPFRSKMFLSRRKTHGSCTAGTFEVQEALVSNHLNMIVRPIERNLGMKVDVFLTDTPCGVEDQQERRTFEETGIKLDGLGSLMRWYGIQRVRGTTRTVIHDNMYERMVGTFNTVADYMRRQQATYEYFIVTRYDVFLDRPFLSMVGPTQPGGARGLRSFSYAHDFLFAFPGEMWGCVQEMWTRCLAMTEYRDVTEGDRHNRRCFRFAELDLHHWASGFGFVTLLRAISTSLQQAAPELTVPYSQLLQWRGVSAIDERGGAHRCFAGVDPPEESKEEGAMPVFFHVG